MDALSPRSLALSFTLTGEAVQIADVCLGPAVMFLTAGS